MVWYLAPLGSLGGLIFAYLFFRQMMGQDEGNPRMREIAGFVRQGAYAYLRQQNRVVLKIMLLAAGVLAFLAFGLHVQSVYVPPAFLVGGCLSALAGYLGMITATNASARTCNAAMTQGLNAGLRIAFRSGAVMGLTVVGLALSFASACFFGLVVFSGETLVSISVTLVSFGMGASFQALFARVGGGIFTKAADVGADLVGKVEAGIPEDDPRNPATIADNVGDNVGDVAGMGADLFESYLSSLLAATALGVAALHALGQGAAAQMNAACVPMVVAGLGVVASVLGIFMVRTREGATQKSLIAALNTGIWTASGILVLGSGLTIHALLGTLQGLPGLGAWGIWLAIVVGLVVGIVIGHATEYFTSAEFRPTQRVAEAGITGSATVILEGVALGLVSTWVPIVAICVGLLLSFGVCGGFKHMTFGLYGISLAAVGMLSTLGITLATDAYGPIADNAGGNAEMAELPSEVREKTDLLDSVGNTTAAIGKGFAIGSAALTATALLAAYGEEIKLRLALLAQAAGGSFTVWGGKVVTAEEARAATFKDLLSWYDVTLLNPLTMVGLFVGGTVACVFCALTMQAVGRSARAMIEEVRRQFRERPGILEGSELPDYARCVAISTGDAQRQMVLPSLLVVAAPVVMGLFLGPAAVMGTLTGGLVCGFLLAVMMANSGGSWDNAKKFVEAGNYGGKGSETHHAVVTGDTVGDPFKDTSGPSLNIAIKLMAIAAVVFAGVTVKYSPFFARLMGIE